MKREDMLKIFNLEILSDINFETIGSNEKIILKDKEGYKYFLSFDNLKVSIRRKQKNPSTQLAKFYRGNIFTKENIESFIKKTNKNFHLKENIGETATTKVSWVCEIHNKNFITSWNCIKNGEGCPICGYKSSAKAKMHTIDWIKQEALKRYNIVIISDFYESNTTRLKFYCLSHPYILQEKSWAQIIQSKCPCKECSKVFLQNKYKIYFFNQMKELYGNKYEFLEEYRGANTKIKIKCNNCGRVFYGTPRHLLSGHACGCNRSRGEERIKLILDRNNIVYEEQKTFKECKDKRKLSFDFYLPDYNLIIEYQGRQHYFSTEKFGGEGQLKIHRIHDNIKKEFAFNNHYNFLEICYKDYKRIEDIIFDKLEGVF